LLQAELNGGHGWLDGMEKGGWRWLSGVQVWMDEGMAIILQVAWNGEGVA